MRLGSRLFFDNTIIPKWACILKRNLSETTAKNWYLLSNSQVLQIDQSTFRRYDPRFGYLHFASSQSAYSDSRSACSMMP